jgi:formylglycine-generating enzyme required for sulfatase activity
MSDIISNSQALPAGTRLEQFIIERVLGSGGFGITYLATDSRLGRKVVIKENLPAQFCFRDPGTLTVAPRHSQGDDAENFQWSLENFSKEAAMLASLDHPGIVRVLHSFEAFGTAYFVMPFMKGETFDELVRKSQKPFSEDELRGLLDRVLSALDHIHQREIYHRDIKPGNILITDEGIPVLIDFGSARQRISERSMTVVESAGYTPFEQLQSRGNVGPWSDLYSLGATLVKAITGETPPKAADRAFDDPFTPLVARAELLGRFSTTFLDSVDRALKSRPAERWQNSNDWKLSLHQPKAADAEPTVIVPKNVVTATPQPAARSVEARKPMPAPKVEEHDYLLSDTVSLRMCWIPPGQFMMGSVEDESGREPDEAWHRVIITNGFWMGKYPVTQEQWWAVMGSNPSHLIGVNHPVDSVSWLDICGETVSEAGFLARINSTAPAVMQFHLPTEAQWEYACRAGTNTALNHGKNLTQVSGQCQNLDEVAWYSRNSGFGTQPVGKKMPNTWGLHDMHGNIAEWCADYYAPYALKSPNDPVGPDKGQYRVYRGGSWINGPKDCRSARRAWVAPECRISSLGFRLVLYSSTP